MTGAVADQPGTVVWTPPADARQSTEIGRYLTWLERERERAFAGYDELWAWSIEDLEGFWGSIWDYFQIRAHTPYERVLSSRAMPGARWFEGAELNYAEHLLGSGDEDPDASAIVAHSQTRDPIELTFGELRDQVARARAGLVRLGVRSGDRVVAYMPNIPETLVAFAAAASLGAVWASCAPELGARSVIDRLAQLDPTVLLAVGGYGFRDRWIDRREEVHEIRARLPTLRHVIGLEYGEHAPRDALAWDDLLAIRPGSSSTRSRSPTRYMSCSPQGLPVAQGDLCTVIEESSSNLQVARAELGPRARRPPAVVHHNLVDDVELTRLGTAPARVGGDDRRVPHLADARLAVAARGADPADLHGRQPHVRDGLAQRGIAARAGGLSRSQSGRSRSPGRRCRSRGTDT